MLRWQRCPGDTVPLSICLRFSRGISARRRSTFPSSFSLSAVAKKGRVKKYARTPAPLRLSRITASIRNWRGEKRISRNRNEIIMIDRAQTMYVCESDSVSFASPSEDTFCSGQQPRRKIIKKKRGISHVVARGRNDTRSTCQRNRAVAACLIAPKISPLYPRAHSHDPNERFIPRPVRS